ncbi:URI1 isoform 4, partial [Pongo abelii]
SISCEEATCSDTSESILEEEPQENQQKKLLPLSITPELNI